MKRLSALLLFLACVAPTLATDVEKRVHFDHGASGTIITGSLDPTEHKTKVRDRYILGAGKGQTVTLNLQATSVVLLYVWHKDYNQGLVCTQQGSSLSQSAQLPADDDYFVDVSPVNNKPASYKLTIEIN